MKVERCELLCNSERCGFFSSKNGEKFLGRGRAWGKNLHLQKARCSLDIKENFVGANC